MGNLNDIRRYHMDVVAVVGRQKAAYRTILIFFIESGALYCFTWVSLGRVCVPAGVDSGHGYDSVM